ncbi:MAG: helix-turn-helix domain-containing protein [Clostridiales bacterium]|nr:helix-turn-helix domain-containing protein [Clostridiales bacterium]
MIHAYDKLYLEKARTALARMLDFAVYDLHMELTEFFNLFIHFGVADLFGCGDPDTLVGKSGIELAYEVLDRSGLSYHRVTPNFTLDRSEEYWTGWALAYYQWETALSFAEIIEYVPIEKIRALYSPYHEMDISQFVDHMNERIRGAKYLTNLKLLRTRAGLSQSQLASSSGVPLRTIQQYEQRQKNINKAQAEYLFMLSRSLSCEPEDLLEKV